MAYGHVTRFRVDPMLTIATAAVLAGFGCGLFVGFAGGLSFNPPRLIAPYEAPEVCELPPPSDPVGFIILQDMAGTGTPA